jgi:hypothetical protein
MLHLHQPEIMSFFPGLLFFSKIWIRKSLLLELSRSEARHMRPAGPAQMMMIFFMDEV